MAVQQIEPTKQPKQPNNKFPSQKYSKKTYERKNSRVNFAVHLIFYIFAREYCKKLYNKQENYGRLQRKAFL